MDFIPGISWLCRASHSWRRGLLSAWQVLRGFQFDGNKFAIWFPKFNVLSVYGILSFGLQPRRKGTMTGESIAKRLAKCFVSEQEFFAFLNRICWNGIIRNSLFESVSKPLEERPKESD